MLSVFPRTQVLMSGVLLLHKYMCNPLGIRVCCLPAWAGPYGMILISSLHYCVIPVVQVFSTFFSKGTPGGQAWSRGGWGGMWPNAKWWQHGVVNGGSGAEGRHCPHPAPVLLLGSGCMGWWVAALRPHLPAYTP